MGLEQEEVHQALMKIEEARSDATLQHMTHFLNHQDEKRTADGDYVDVYGFPTNRIQLPFTLRQ